MTTHQTYYVRGNKSQQLCCQARVLVFWGLASSSRSPLTPRHYLAEPRKQRLHKAENGTLQASPRSPANAAGAFSISSPARHTACRRVEASDSLAREQHTHFGRALKSGKISLHRVGAGRRISISNYTYGDHHGEIAPSQEGSVAENAVVLLEWIHSKICNNQIPVGFPFYRTRKTSDQFPFHPSSSQD